jgi:hypothetical protein
MKKHKIIIGEWVSVYCNTTLIVTTDKDIKNMTAKEVAKLLDHDDKTTFDTEEEDYDWSTVGHEEWDQHDEVCNGYTYLHEIKEEEQTK